MKIKDEYKGKTIMKNTSLGNMMIIVDNIDVNRYRYYVSIGFGYLFEEETTTAPEQCIRYEGIEADEQMEAPAPTPTPKRKRKTNAKANTKRNQG